MPIDTVASGLFIAIQVPTTEPATDTILMPPAVSSWLVPVSGADAKLQNRPVFSDVPMYYTTYHQLIKVIVRLRYKVMKVHVMLAPLPAESWLRLLLNVEMLIYFLFLVKLHLHTQRLFYSIMIPATFHE